MKRSHELKRATALSLAVLLILMLMVLAGCSGTPATTTTTTTTTTTEPVVTTQPTTSQAETTTSLAATDALFADDFENGAGNWTQREGEWEIVTDDSSAYQQGDRDAWEAISTAGEYGWTDYSYTARFKLHNGYAGLLGRVDDAGNMYLFDLNELGYSVWRKYQEGWSQILPDTEYSIGVDVWHTVTMTFAGNQITLFIDGEQVGDPITDNLIGSGMVGFRSSYGTFTVDDVIVE